MKYLTALCIFCSLFIFAGNGLAQGEKIKVVVAAEDMTGKFPDLVKWFGQDLVKTGRYVVVKDLKDAQYYVEVKLVSAEEIMINKVPASNVSLIVMVKQTDKVGVFANTIISRQGLMDVKLEDAVKQAAKDGAESLAGFRLRFNFPPSKKSGTSTSKSV
ncbi:MAG: hypothetical protein V1645_01445 [archaeon]